jgi:hypothetical protein
VAAAYKNSLLRSQGQGDARLTGSLNELKSKQFAAPATIGAGAADVRAGWLSLP